MLTDAVLVNRVISGFDGAFDELYRRHADAAWRLAQAVAGNAQGAADAVAEAFARVVRAVQRGQLQDGDAFTSYLLAATRNAALDDIRRAGKAEPTTNPGDAAPIAVAFRNLPERWRSVLWLTEVEGITTDDAAAQLGLSVKSTTQLAARARAGLGDHYLQAHDGDHARLACRFTIEHLGAYLGARLSARELTMVDQHLAGCDDCRARKAQLDDLGTSLRGIVLPLPIDLAAASAGRVRRVLASSAAPVGVGKIVQFAKEPTPAMRRFVAASAAGVLALGVLSVGFVDGNHDAGPSGDGLAAPKQLGAPATASPPELALAISYGTPVGVSGSPARRSFSGGGFAAPAGGGDADGTGSATPGPSDAPAPSGQPPEAVAPLPIPLPDQVCTLLAILCPPASSSDAPSSPIAGPSGLVSDVAEAGSVGRVLDDVAEGDELVARGVGGGPVLRGA